MSDWDLRGQHETGMLSELGPTTKKPDARAAETIIKHHLQRQQVTRKRKILLSPDGLPIERYTLGVAADQIIPTLHDHVLQLSGARAPDTNFRPQRITSNAPSPGYVLLNLLKLGNVTAIVGGDSPIDAWQLNATAWEEEMDLPTLTPANSMSFTGAFQGLLVTPFKFHDFQFVVSGSGPAVISPFEDLTPVDPR